MFTALAIFFSAVFGMVATLVMGLPLGLFVAVPIAAAAGWLGADLDQRKRP